MKRECGTCTLCCKLLPMPPLGKPADTRCQHQRFNGCAIYAARPAPCRVWHCRWLINDDAADLRRPDRAHYVIDMMPDYVTLRDNESGDATRIPVVQIWIDPAHPDAHRDPRLRAWLERLYERNGHIGLLRYGSHKGVALIPPAMNSTGEWIEHGSGMAEKDHDFADIAAVVRGEG